MEDKKQFFDIYQKVKKEKINIKTLDSETISRILQILNEEIKINNRRIAQKTEEIKAMIKTYNQKVNFVDFESLNQLTDCILKLE